MWGIAGGQRLSRKSNLAALRQFPIGQRWRQFFTVGESTECWLWRGSKTADGYGHFNALRKHHLAHRGVYNLLKGEIPPGMQLDHLCRTRLCVNPNHMEVVTQQENIRRGKTGENMRSRTHCRRGHEYNEENTAHPRKNPKWRDCKLCRKINGAKSRGRVHAGE